jgi:hypothetical protein
VTQCVPAADAGAGAAAATTSAAAAQLMSLIDVPPSYGVVVDKVKVSVRL